MVFQDPKSTKVRIRLKHVGDSQVQLFLFKECGNIRRCENCASFAWWKDARSVCFAALLSSPIDELSLRRSAELGYAFAQAAMAVFASGRARFAFASLAFSGLVSVMPLEKPPKKLPAGLYQENRMIFVWSWGLQWYQTWNSSPKFELFNSKINWSSRIQWNSSHVMLFSRVPLL